MLEISSGVLHGHFLEVPKGTQTRPTSSRQRQALFNVLRHRSSLLLEEAIVVDLFCGTGALGIEAASNGAKEIYFVEQSDHTIRVLKKNVGSVLKAFEKQKLQPPQFYILESDAVKTYPKLPLCDLMFCDPPYQKGWVEKILECEQTHSKLKPGGLFIAETAEKEAQNLNLNWQNLIFEETKTYGETSFHFFSKK